MKKHKGQAAILSIVIVSIIALTISTSISKLIVNELKMAQNAENSVKAYYASEGAMNDLLTAMKHDNNWPSVPYNDIIIIDEVEVQRVVEGEVMRDITVIGRAKDITKKIKAYCDKRTGSCDVFEVVP